MLKELKGSFLPDPVAMFPPSYSVVGELKQVRAGKGTKITEENIQKVDMNLRESTLLVLYNNY